MHKIDLQKADLNLLVLLEILLQERSVTAAAHRLGRTQSAISHALSRLRHQFGDPLLVRVGGEMRATPKAEALAGELSRVLRAVHRLLSDEPPFDPGTTTRTFSIAAPDFIGAMLSSLLQVFSAEAPLSSIELLAPSREMFRELLDGALTLIVAPGKRAPMEGLRQRYIGELRWAVFARKGHPASRRWSAQSWARYPHIQIRTTSGAESPVELLARQHGLERRTIAYLPNFLLAPSLLTESDALLTVPKAILSAHAERLRLSVLSVPFEVAPLPLSLYWPSQRDRDGATSWLRAAAQKALEGALLAASRVKEIKLRA